jgi:hypothetical protein
MCSPVYSLSILPHCHVIVLSGRRDKGDIEDIMNPIKEAVQFGEPFLETEAFDAGRVRRIHDFQSRTRDTINDIFECEAARCFEDTGCFYLMTGTT